MRNRSRADARETEQHQQRERSQPPRAQARERSGKRERPTGREQPTGRARVGKIQYRFIKEVEENGVNGELRMGALAMADKIKRYPLDAQHVMGSWERFTKKDIEEFKANRGNHAERERIQIAYAVVFSALRDARPVESVKELKQRIDAFSAKHPPIGADRAGESRKEVMKNDPAAPQQPRQQSLLERERPTIEQQMETALSTVRGLSSPLRGAIEGSARELIVEGHHSQRSAREALPTAVREFQADKSERNTVHMLTLAVIAKAPEHRALLRDLWDMPREQMKEIEAESRSRLERYPPLETGLADLRNDAVEASVRAAVAPSAPNQREALVLAHAREELECLADPKRAQWQNVSDELARDLA